MLYAKKAITLEKQTDQLIGRGLIADRDELIARLKAVNYYRLSGYLHPFRLRDAHGARTEGFIPGTTLETVWRRYCFDRRLRIVVLDAIERIEVSVRTRMVYHFVHSRDAAGCQIGPFGHLIARNLPGFKERSLPDRCWRNLKRFAQFKGIEHSDFVLWLAKLQNEQRRASEDFVKHFRKTYGDCHEHLPLWMASELMTCETTLQFANGLDRAVLKLAAADFGFPDEQLRSWTKAIFTLRNASAHHSRIWNRVFGVKPSVPGKNKNPQWHISPGFANDRAGILLTVCHHWLGKVTPTTRWKARLFALFDEYPEIPLAEMGLPPDWRTHPLWR